jgi:predicted HTH transcriptional regulator
MRLSDADFTAIIGAGQELASVEFKPGGPRAADDLFYKVARAVLAMTNRRDGGVVILGVEEDQTAQTIALKGVASADLVTWNQNDLSAALNGFADPFVSVEAQIIEHAGLSFVVINVSEFEQLPVICRKGTQAPAGQKNPTLRAGALYVRSRRKPESIEVPGQTEMRELVRYATDKELRDFMRRAALAGLIQFVGAPGDTDDAAFENQLGDFR